MAYQVRNKQFYFTHNKLEQHLTDFDEAKDI
jgi:hypothetical protein